MQIKGEENSGEGQNLIGLPYIRQITCDLSSKGKGLQFCLLPPIYFQESCQYIGIHIAFQVKDMNCSSRHFFYYSFHLLNEKYAQSIGVHDKG